jgi:hypothetical protein
MAADDRPFDAENHDLLFDEEMVDES